MYWPIGHVQHIRDEESSGPDDTLLDFCYNRRTNLFVTYSARSLTLWSSEPTCRIARVERTNASLQEYGKNRYVEWSGDGHSIFVSTTANHILKYDLVESEPVEANDSSLFISARAARINIEVPHIFQSFPPGAGQGEVYDISPSAIMTSTNIPELRFRNGGIMRFKGSIIGQAYYMGHHLPPRQRGLLVAHTDVAEDLIDTLDSGARATSGFLRIPSRIPDDLLWKGSREQTLPSHGWPFVDADAEDQVDVDKWSWQDTGIRLANDETIVQFHSTKIHSILYAITSHGNAFLVFPMGGTDDNQRADKRENHREFWTSVQVFDCVGAVNEKQEEGEKATSIDLNTSFGLCAVGTSKGRLVTVKLDLLGNTTRAWTSSCVDEQNSHAGAHTTIRSLSWTSDGYALAVQLDRKWALYSPFGDLVFCQHLREPPISNAGTGNGVIYTPTSSSEFGKRVTGKTRAGLAWLPGNFGLLMLNMNGAGMQIVPFAKSSSTMQQDPLSPYKSLVLYDEIRVSKGADRHPGDLLDHTRNLFEPVKIPLVYAINQCPIRYTAISADGTLLACAGRHGLTHYSFASGRWKLFAEVAEEASFSVRGGLVWYHHVLIAPVHINGLHEIHLYSRDLDLEFRNVLHIESMDHAVLSMSLEDDNLLVYTSDNMLHHFAVRATAETVEIRLCGSISLTNFVLTPSHVKSITCFVPPMTDLHQADLISVAYILVLFEGRLLILRKEIKSQEYRLLHGAESCLTFDRPDDDRGCIWSNDGRRIQLVQPVNLLATPTGEMLCGKSIEVDTRETGSIFAVAPPMGLAIRLASSCADEESEEQARLEVSCAPLLFLPKLLKSLLEEHGVQAAVTFARRFANLPYFRHVLEVLLMQALDEEDVRMRQRSTVRRVQAATSIGTDNSTDDSSTGLERVVRFLDNFSESTTAIIACARKSEAELWPTLFDFVGSPRDLFNDCLNAETPALEAASNLLVIIHTLDQTASVQEDIRRLLAAAFGNDDQKLCRDILRFALSVGEDIIALTEEPVKESDTREGVNSQALR